MVECYKCQTRTAMRGSGLCEKCSTGFLGSEPLSFTQFEIEYLSGDLVRAFTNADEELLLYAFLKRYKIVVPRMAYFTNTEFLKLIDWYSDTMLKVLDERLGPEWHESEITSSIPKIVGDYITTGMKLLPNSYANAELVDLDKRAMLRRLLKNTGMDPNVVGELENRFAIGSGLFLVELCANAWTAGKLNKLMGALTTWSKTDAHMGNPILMRDPWNHQYDALEAWLDAGYMGILEMATGTGKTLVALAALEWLYNHERGEGDVFKVIILSHSLALLSQWRRMAIEELGLPANIDLPYDVPVVTDSLHIDFKTIQSVMKKPDEQDCDFLIVDEVHHAASPEFRKALEVNAFCRMGLSATVEGKQRLDHLKPRLGDVVYRYPLKKAIDDGVLPNFDWKLYPIELSIEEQVEFKKLSKSITESFKRLSGDKKTIRELTDGRMERVRDLGDFFRVLEIARYKKKELPEDWKMLQILVLKRRWTLHKSQPKLDNAIKLTESLAQSKKCVAFTMDIQSANEIAERLADKGISVFPVHSQIKDDIRWARIQRFKEAKTGVLVAPKVLDEGIDIPDAEIGINVASSKTRLQLVQRIGRIIRMRKGKHPEFHHFVGVPTPELQLVYEDGLEYLDDVSWVQDTAMKMGVTAQTQPGGITNELTIARNKAEEYFAERFRQGENVKLPSYGSLKLENIVNSIPPEIRQALIVRLDEIGDAGGVHRLGDRSWSILVRKAYEKVYPEYAAKNERAIDLSGHIWILLAGERLPGKIAGLLKGQ